MRTESQASSQSGRSIDADAWCNRTLSVRLHSASASTFPFALNFIIVSMETLTLTQNMGLNPILFICALLPLDPSFSKTRTQTLTPSVSGSLEILRPSHSSQNFGFANSLPLQYCFSDKQLTDRGMLVFLKFCKILVSARYCIECVQ